MPRQRDPDEEDLAMVRCPRCKGSGRIYRIDIEAQADCPVCFGTGSVTQDTYEAYYRDLGTS